MSLIKTHGGDFIVVLILTAWVVLANTTFWQADYLGTPRAFNNLGYEYYRVGQYEDARQCFMVAAHYNELFKTDYHGKPYGVAIQKARSNLKALDAMIQSEAWLKKHRGRK